MLISNGRALLHENFLKSNLSKVKEVKDYLKNEIMDDRYLVFYPGEYWLILYWTQEYEEMLQNIEDFTSDQFYDSQGKVPPQPDMLYYDLTDISRRSKDMLMKYINYSNLGELEKEFLRMHLSYMLMDENPVEAQQEELNARADDFLNKYPGNDYAPFTWKYIKYKLVPAKGALAFECYGGYALFTDELQKHYNHNIPFGNAFDIYYRKFVLYLRNYLAVTKTKTDFTYEEGSCSCMV